MFCRKYMNLDEPLLKKATGNCFAFCLHAPQEYRFLGSGFLWWSLYMDYHRLSRLQSFKVPAAWLGAQKPRL